MDSLNKAYQNYTSFVNPFKYGFLNEIKFNRYFNKAKGCYLYDNDNRMYLDFISGYGTATLGHSHNLFITRFHQLIDCNRPNINPWMITPETGRLAATLIKLSNQQFNKVYFSSTGAEAIESALKFAMAYTQRTKFLTVSNDFHGLLLTSTQLTANSFWTNALPELPYKVDYIEINDINRFEDLITQELYAAIIIEPIQGSAADKQWDKGKLKKIELIIKDHGGLLILDEIMTGLGRTGDWFAYQTICPELNPDMLVTSKGLTGGLIPFSAVLMKEAVYDAMFKKSFGTNHSATFSEYFLGSACALTVLEITEKENLLINAKKMETLFVNELNKLQQQGYPIFSSHATGLFVTFGIDTKKSHFTASELCIELLHHGVLTLIMAHTPDYIRLTPALIVGENEIHYFIQQLKIALDTLGENNG